MLSYCQDLRSCRRSLIGEHFGEQWQDGECKGMCDNCQGTQNGEQHTFLLTRISIFRILEIILKLLKL